MAATPTTLRIGESIRLRGTPVNYDGSVPGDLTNISWGGNNAAIATVLQDSGDPYLATVTGVSSGSTVADMFGDDFFTIHTGEQDITVLKASRLLFSFKSLVLKPEPLAANVTGITIEAIPWDSRDDNENLPDYTAGSPGITDILWSSANNSVQFGGIRGGSPAGSDTYTASLKVAIYPDNQNSSEAVTDVITVSCKNIQGETITGTIGVTIIRTEDITVTQET